MTPGSGWQMDQRLALHGIHAPRSARLLARLLVVLTVLGAVALVVTPWQQTIPGTGRVIAFSPEERPQEVQALVDGRVATWHVVEGSVVKAGDPIVDLADNDPAAAAFFNTLGMRGTAFDPAPPEQLLTGERSPGASPRRRSGRLSGSACPSGPVPRTGSPGRRTRAPLPR